MTSHARGAPADRARDDQPMLQPPLTTRLRPAHWVAIDCVIAVLLAVVFLVGSTKPAYGIPVWVAYLFALVSTLPAAARRLWTLPVLAVVLAGSVAAMAIGSGKNASLVTAFAIYPVALRYPRRTSATVLAGALALTAAGSVAGGATPSDNRVSSVTAQFVSSALVIAAGWLIGVAVRAQRAYSAGLREQAEQRVQAQLEEGHRAVVEERLRIARELHDVVAHGLSLIAMQAGVGNYVASAKPDEAARALASIEAISRTALREMRRLVGVLRDGEPEGPALEPAPGLADLGRLITGTAAAGVRVQLEVRGTRPGVPPGVDLAAYRIVQEALTNVVKHAQTTASRVVVTYEQDAIGLEVTDEGHGITGPASSGHGLAGIRERASLYGGEFHAGPLPGRGFRVAARLPLDNTPGEPVNEAVP